MRLYIPYRYAPWRWIDTWSWNRFHIPLRPRYFIQRALQGWSDADVGNLDCYLARVMSGGLNRLADVTHGYVLGNDDIRTLAEDDEPDSVEQMKRWREILREMAAGFHGHSTWEDGVDYHDYKAYDLAFTRMKAKRKKSLRLLETYFDGLWD
jgi:hypothetical protein